MKDTKANVGEMDAIFATVAMIALVGVVGNVGMIAYASLSTVLTIPIGSASEPYPVCTPTYYAANGTLLERAFDPDSKFAPSGVPKRNGEFVAPACTEAQELMAYSIKVFTYVGAQHLRPVERAQCRGLPIKAR